MGTAANSIPKANIPILRSGPRLSTEAATSLCSPVTHGEIDAALSSIDDSKAPGLDGFNSVFFKKAWHLIKAYVYRAVQFFFQSKQMYMGVNCTSITLVSKLVNASHVKDFRPIACCTLLYKIISKVLTARLQRVVYEVVSECQSGFIPGRYIADNILLATELIKGYGRSHLSPRCGLKLTSKKLMTQ